MSKNNLAAFLLLSIFAGCICQTKNVKGYWTFTTKYNTNTLNSVSYSYDSVDINVNYDSDKKKAGPTVPLQFDLQYGSLFTGLMNSNDWGIYCGANSQPLNTTSNCMYTSQEQFYYNGAQYTGNKATTLLPFDGVGNTNNQIQGDVVTSPNQANNPTKDTGVLGLGINSQLVKYMLNQYNFQDYQLNGQNTFISSIQYYLNDDSGKFTGTAADTWSYSTVTLGGYDSSRLDSTQPVSTVNLKSGSTAWAIPAVTVSTQTTVLSAYDACISNANNNAMFAMTASDRATLIKGLCGNQQSQCSFSSVKEPGLSLKYTDSSNNQVVINLILSDYAYADANGNLALAVDDISTWNNKSACVGYKLGLGRLFLYKMMVYFQTPAQGTPSISVGSLLPVTQISNGERIALAFFSGTLLLIIIVASVIRLREDDTRMNGEYMKP